MIGTEDDDDDDDEGITSLYYIYTDRVGPVHVSTSVIKQTVIPNLVTCHTVTTSRVNRIMFSSKYCSTKPAVFFTIGFFFQKSNNNASWNGDRGICGDKPPLHAMYPKCEGKNY